MEDQQAYTLQEGALVVQGQVLKKTEQKCYNKKIKAITYRFYQPVDLGRTVESIMMGEKSTGLSLTQAAVDKVAALICEEQDTNLRLRIYISGGGCSGFQYGFQFDHDDKPGDRNYPFTSNEIEQADGERTRVKVVLVVDPISFSYLQGASVDYQVGVGGQRFVVNNPNANTQCGCGSSFSVDEASEEDDATTSGDEEASA